MYLTATHQSPPSHITADGKRWPVATLIARDDREKLASLGVYWHRPDTEPGPHGPWEFVDGEYRREPIVPSEAEQLATRKAQMQSTRSARRVQAQTSGFAFDGNTYASDRDESIPLLSNVAISAQIALSQGADAVASFETALGEGWRSIDGVGRITTAAGILALHAAFVAHGAACDRNSQVLKAQIEAAETLMDLDAIDTEAGWPALGE
jgi:hypothetical protein